MNRRFDKHEWLRWFAGRNEVLMFSFSLTYLVCLAALVVVWVDVPGLRERAKNVLGRDQSVSHQVIEFASSQLGQVVLVVMFIVWCVVTVEAVVHWITRPWTREMRNQHLQSLLFCICPALRMCARSHEMHGRIWLPGMGWRQGGRRLQRQLERKFSIPMMVVALLIMPILIIEFFMKDQVAAYGWLRLFLHVGTGVIWFVFAAEFILMVSVAEKKIEYCKQHWIDLAIILLPLVSFLRSLSVLRATPLANLMRIQQITNLARAYRLRGTAIKALRVLILFDLINRVIHVSEESRIVKLEKELAEMELQTRLLRQRIARLRLQKQEKESRTAAEDQISENQNSDDDCENDEQSSSSTEMADSRSG